MVKNRIRVLMSAYACEPNKGSEPGVGWNWAIQMANWNEVYVITRSNNKDVIEAYLKRNPVEHLHFYYHDCSALKRKLKNCLMVSLFTIKCGRRKFYLWRPELLNRKKLI